MLKLTVSHGQEVVTELDRQLRAQGINDAAVASLIGAVDSCAISNMRVDDAGHDIVTEYTQPLELSGTGEIVDGKLHLHVVLGKQGNGAVAGHLHWARVEKFFVRAYVVTF